MKKKICIFLCAAGIYAIVRYWLCSPVSIIDACQVGLLSCLLIQRLRALMSRRHLWSADGILEMIACLRLFWGLFELFFADMPVEMADDSAGKTAIPWKLCYRVIKWLLTFARKAGRMRKEDGITQMAFLLFVVGAVFLLAGVFTLASAVEVSSLAQSAMHQIYAAEMTGNAILLFGFGFLLIGVACIILQNNSGGQPPSHTDTAETGASFDARTHAQARRGNNRQNEKAKDLSWAAHYGEIDTANALIKGGANVNARDAAGWRPLHRAAAGGRIDIANVLIKAGADVNTKTNSGKTPLHLAAQKDRTDMAITLIKAGADLHIRSDANETALQIATYSGNSKTENLLRKAISKQNDKTGKQM